MTFKEFLQTEAVNRKLLKMIRRKKTSRINSDNYTGKNNYINQPSVLPSKQLVGGFPDSNVAGYPSV